MGTITIGIDLAKQAFSTCETTVDGRVYQRKDFRRNAFAAWLPQVPPGTVVAMEACSGAHHWARRCQDYGSTPRLKRRSGFGLNELLDLSGQADSTWVVR